MSGQNAAAHPHAGPLRRNARARAMSTQGSAPQAEKKRHGPGHESLIIRACELEQTATRTAAQNSVGQGVTPTAQVRAESPNGRTNPLQQRSSSRAASTTLTGRESGGKRARDHLPSPPSSHMIAGPIITPERRHLVVNLLNVVDDPFGSSQSTRFSEHDPRSTNAISHFSLVPSTMPFLVSPQPGSSRSTHHLPRAAAFWSSATHAPLYAANCSPTTPCAGGALPCSLCGQVSR